MFTCGTYSGYFRLATAKKNLNELESAADVLKVTAFLSLTEELENLLPISCGMGERSSHACDCMLDERRKLRVFL